MVVSYLVVQVSLVLRALSLMMTACTACLLLIGRYALLLTGIIILLFT